MESGQQIFIDPTCLSGDKAWARWMVWKKKYEESKRFSGSYQKIKPTFSQVKKEISRTRKFLEEIYKKTPTSEDIRAASENRTMKRWVNMGKVSPYFVVLCDDIDNEQSWGLDLGLYKENITPEMKEWFDE